MRFLSTLFTCLFLARAAVAHEFWIAPEDYTVDPGAPIVADLRVGQDFEGSPQTYFPNRFARFEVKTAAPACRGPRLTTTATSGSPLDFRPTATPAASNPCGAVTLTGRLRSW